MSSRRYFDEALWYLKITKEVMKSNALPERNTYSIPQYLSDQTNTLLSLRTDQQKHLNLKDLKEAASELKVRSRRTNIVLTIILFIVFAKVGDINFKLFGGSVFFDVREIPSEYILFLGCFMLAQGIRVIVAKIWLYSVIETVCDRVEGEQSQVLKGLYLGFDSVEMKNRMGKDLFKSIESKKAYYIQNIFEGFVTTTVIIVFAMFPFLWISFDIISDPNFSIWISLILVLICAFQIILPSVYVLLLVKFPFKIFESYG